MQLQIWIDLVTANFSIYQPLTLEAGARLTVDAGSSLSIFAPLAGGAELAQSTVLLEQFSSLFAAGPVASTIRIDLSGVGSSLRLAEATIAGMSGEIAGLREGTYLALSTTRSVDRAEVSLVGGLGLELISGGATIARLRLADWTGQDRVWVVPDPVDGFRLLVGQTPPSVGNPSTLSGPSQGAKFIWLGQQSGSWHDSTRWLASGAGGNPQTEPGANDSVTIGGSPFSVCAVSGDAAAHTVAITGNVALCGSFAIYSLSIVGEATGTLIVDGTSRLSSDTLCLGNGCITVSNRASVLISDVLSAGSGLAWISGCSQVTASTVTLAGATLRIDSGSALNVGKSSKAASVSIGLSGEISGYGSIRGDVIDDGRIVASNGLLSIFGGLDGTGVVQLAPGGALFVSNGAAASLTMEMSGPTTSETLELLGSASQYQATLLGFGYGDVLEIFAGKVELAAWRPAPVSVSDIGVIDLGNLGHLRLALQPGIDPSGARFAATPDGEGGSKITLVSCFAAGTRLRTPTGERRVETIRVGDHLVVGSGRPRRVKWVFRSVHDANDMTSQPQLRPVLVRAGALGQGRPRANLLLSPQHGLIVATAYGERIVPAASLVNGKSIRRVNQIFGVKYYHVGLGSHDIVFANGARAESYRPADTSLRGIRRGNVLFGSRTHPCRPMLTYGPALNTLRNRLFGRSSLSRSDRQRVTGRIESVRRGASTITASGWVSATDCGEPTWLDVFQNEQLVARTVANLWRGDLDYTFTDCQAFGFIVHLPISCHIAPDGQSLRIAASSHADYGAAGNNSTTGISRRLGSPPKLQSAGKPGAK